MKASSLLPEASDIQSAFENRVIVETSPGGQAPEGAGDVLKSAAVDSAFRRFRGQLLVERGERPVAISTMALIFKSRKIAERMFNQVAEAAHLKTEVDGCSVTVETVTGASGLVSYWGYLWRDKAMVIATLDTVDPQEVSISDLRSLVGIIATRLRTADQGSA